MNDLEQTTSTAEENLEQARAAVADMLKAKAAWREARDRRDAAVCRMVREDGMSKPQVARAIGYSSSMARHIVDTKSGTL